MAGLFAWVAAVAAASPNVLVLIADDLGVDKLSSYADDVPGYQPDPDDAPVTPMLDELAADGVRFRQAWANPVCSPTRAGLMSGRHAYRTGVGSVLGSPTNPMPTRPFRMTETTLAEALDADYATGFFGKWHLGDRGLDRDGDDDPLDWETFGVRDAVPNPNAQGFEVFDGALWGAIPSYWQWPRVVADAYGHAGGDERSEVSTSTSYATRAVAESAADFVVSAPEPFLAVVSFHAGHADGMGDGEGWAPDHALEGCSTITSASNDREGYRAMIECLDHEIDRLLAALEGAGRLDDTVIFFVGDNGTDPRVGDPGFPHSADGKGTAFEAGVRVPLIVAEGKHLDGMPYDAPYIGLPFDAGDLVAAGAVSSALVGTIDLFDTILELAGEPPRSTDSVSFAPQLLDPAAPGRGRLYTEIFHDVDQDGTYGGFAAIRNVRWKLVVEQVERQGRAPCQAGSLFDLIDDPDESADRYDDPAVASIRDRLRAGIDAKVTAFEAGSPSADHWFLAASENPASCP